MGSAKSDGDGALDQREIEQTALLAGIEMDPAEREGFLRALCVLLQHFGTVSRIPIDTAERRGAVEASCGIGDCRGDEPERFDAAMATRSAADFDEGVFFVPRIK